MTRWFRHVAGAAKRRRSVNKCFIILCGVVTTIVLILWLSFGDSFTEWWFRRSNLAETNAFLFFLPPLVEVNNNGFPIYNKSHILEWRGPPTLSPIQLAKIQEMEASEDKSALRVLNYLGQIVQGQLLEIQTRRCESNESLLICGHRNGCGFGCQVHARIGCLMASYALNMPLLHDQNSPLPYPGRWEDLFLNYSSSCRVTDRSIVWLSSSAPNHSVYLSPCIRGHIGGGVPLDDWGCYQVLQSFFHPNEEAGLRGIFPLHAGIPMSKELGRVLTRVHSSPFLWMTSQFAKFVLRPQPALQLRMEQWEKASEEGPVVGIHVRRTDKWMEQVDSVHPLSVYMRHVEEFFVQEEENRGLRRNGLIRQVFISSDEFSILKEARQHYKNWELRGHPVSQNDTKKLNVTHYDVDGGMESVFRDVLGLASTDHVICGYSSNICRLVVELFAGRTPDPKSKFVSLDGLYYYPLLNFHVPESIVLVPP